VLSGSQTLGVGGSISETGNSTLAALSSGATSSGVVIVTTLVIVSGGIRAGSTVSLIASCPP
jgi:hypothetical protein